MTLFVMSSGSHDQDVCSYFFVLFNLIPFMFYKSFPGRLGHLSFLKSLSPVQAFSWVVLCTIVSNKYLIDIICSVCGGCHCASARVNAHLFLCMVIHYT